MFIIRQYVAVQTAFRGYRAVFLIYDEFYTPGGRAVQGLLFVYGVTTGLGSATSLVREAVFFLVYQVT